MNDPSELLALAETLTTYAAAAHANQKQCIFANMRALLGHSAVPLSEESSKKKKKRYQKTDTCCIQMSSVVLGKGQGEEIQLDFVILKTEYLQQCRVHSLTQTAAGGKQCLVP